MSFLRTYTLPVVEEDEATGEVAKIYDEIKREMQVPHVPNIMKALAVSPAALAIQWGIYANFFKHTTLPQSLAAMILYAVAESNNCAYCSAGHELTCRTLGIDESTLAALVEDLSNVSPERIRAIIEFAVKVAQNPQALGPEDYQQVLEQGVTEGELAEIIMTVALGNCGDTVADALKVEVDPMAAEIVGRKTTRTAMIQSTTSTTTLKAVTEGK